MAILPRLHPRPQRLQVRCELSAVALDRDAIDAHRCIAAQVVERTLEGWLVDEMSQREDSLIRMSFRSLRYLHEFW
jgi:hypothetical protein